jgi:hypothetical protein
MKTDRTECFLRTYKNHIIIRTASPARSCRPDQSSPHLHQYPRRPPLIARSMREPFYSNDRRSPPGLPRARESGHSGQQSACHNGHGLSRTCLRNAVSTAAPTSRST